jgi:hypothetical protein
MKLHASANAVSVASISARCSWIGRSLQGSVRMVSYRKYYITCKRHIQSSAKAWKSVSSSSVKTLRLPRAKAQRVL